MDQMASVGIEFDKQALDRLFKQSVDYYEHLSAANAKQKAPSTQRWAVDPIYTDNRPVRPWGLGAINKTSSLLYWLAGQVKRTPGLYRQTDPRTGADLDKFLQDTNERVHSSVRIRLACDGLGLNDKGVWTCPALHNWKVKRTEVEYSDPIPRHPSWGLGNDVFEKPKERWVWEYNGDEKGAPSDTKQRFLVEDTLGPYEQYLLKISAGKPNVFEFAEDREVD